MKKTTLTIVMFSIFISISFSQKWNTMIDLGDMAIKTTHSHNEMINSVNNSTVEGSMFLYDDFRPGNLIIKGDTLIEGIKFRYNIYSKQMEMVVNNDTLALIRPEKVKNIYFDRKSFIYTAYEEKNKIELDYFQVLSEGKSNLLLHYKVIFIPKNPPATPYSTGNPNDQLEQSKNYFYQKGDKPAILLSKKSKNILESLSDKKTEVDKYIKEKDLKATNEKDMVEIFQYYNSLK